MDEQCSQSPEEMGQVIYTEPYLIKRPLLEAIMSSQGDPPVLLINELDRADEEFEAFLLETQMARLKRKSYTIIWLNPLMETSAYQPICQGMRTALPYVDAFLPMDNTRDLALLGRILVEMMA